MKERLFLLAVCAFVVAAILLLAAGLHEVQFRPGRPLPMSSSSAAPIVLQVSQLASETPLWKILLLWLAGVVNLVLFFYLLPPELRKKIVKQISGLATALLILLLAVRYRVLTLPALTAWPANPAGQITAASGGDADLQSFHAPAVPAWAEFLVAVAVLSILGGLLAVAYLRWRQAQAGRNFSLGEIADVARDSLRELVAGRDLGDVIVHCYVRMSEAVRVHRGLVRRPFTTVREFTDQLTGAGLPAEAVGTLTRLFEAARYGAHHSSDSERTEALDCLTDILRACGTVS